MNNNQQPTYAVGQVWRYRHRATEPDSRAIIVKITTDPRYPEDIIHVYVNNLKINNPNLATPMTVLSHLPLSGAAMNNSVTEVESTIDTLPAFHNGYEAWHREFAKGQAGVIDLPLSEIIAVMEMALPTT